MPDNGTKNFKREPRVPIVIKTWAGDDKHDLNYIMKSIPSLLSSDLPDWVDVVIYDDFSSSAALKRYLNELDRTNDKVTVIWGKNNLGPNAAQVAVYKYIENEYPQAPFYINCDDDVIYHKKWLQMLIDAKSTCDKNNITGVFSALNMPFRKVIQQITISEQLKGLLKYKQPALNWLIPKQVYDETGGFADEGIAYDTVFSHWLRLYGYYVICLKPSYVQNIGKIGAYSKDSTTTADDFVNETNKLFNFYFKLGWRYIQKNISTLQKKRLFDISPIRWGAEMVYQGEYKNGERNAFFFSHEALNLGWAPKKFNKRVNEVKPILDKESTMGITEIITNRQGDINTLCFNWQFLPNLRENKLLSDDKKCLLSIPSLFMQLTQSVCRFHEAGIVHNKIRLENIYVSKIDKSLKLAWFGVELPDNFTFPCIHGDILDIFSNALDKRASPMIKEKFTTRFLETIAPEVIDGQGPSFRSDIFAIGACLLCYMDNEFEKLSVWEDKRKSWYEGNFYTTHKNDISDQLKIILLKCVAKNPNERFQNACFLQKKLKNILS
jgi:hypothetical protein